MTNLHDASTGPKMKLVEALTFLAHVIQRNAETYGCFIETGFNPLYLKSCLAADLSVLVADQRTEIQHVLYDNVLGKYGPLGKIAVFAGRQDGTKLSNFTDIELGDQFFETLCFIRRDNAWQLMPHMLNG